MTLIDSQKACLFISDGLLTCSSWGVHITAGRHTGGAGLTRSNQRSLRKWSTSKSTSNTRATGIDALGHGSYQYTPLARSRISNTAYYNFSNLSSGGSLGNLVLQAKTKGAHPPRCILNKLGYYIKSRGITSPYGVWISLQREALPPAKPHPKSRPTAARYTKPQTWAIARWEQPVCA